LQRRRQRRDRRIRRCRQRHRPPELAGWKDTVYVPPRTPLRLLVNCAQPADERTPFMLHCHGLWHEDQGMVAQYVVEAAG
jgi:FtsP/CotA-like multicopper oxidase with cupredoxin domain